MNKDKIRLLTEFTEKIIDRNKNWLENNENPEKLYQHEAIKSFCLQLGSNGVTEYKKEYRTYKRIKKGRVDFVDDTFAVEIDDARNINALRKLIVMEEEDGRIPLWIAHHFSMFSISRMKRDAKQYKIPLLIIHSLGDTELLVPGEDGIRKTKRVKYKVPPGGK